MYSIHSPLNCGSIEAYQYLKEVQYTVHIFDARPKIAAMGNKFKGKGFESSANYRNCSIQFMNIENAPTMNSAYKKLSSAIVK